jgi:hypothetical protein
MNYNNIPNNLSKFPKPLMLMRQIACYPHYQVLKLNVEGFPDNVENLYDLAKTLSIYKANNPGINKVSYIKLIQLNQQRINAENNQ